jgi:hypothetical protein
MACRAGDIAESPSEISQGVGASAPTIRASPFLLRQGLSPCGGKDTKGGLPYSGAKAPPPYHCKIARLNQTDPYQKNTSLHFCDEEMYHSARGREDRRKPRLCEVIPAPCRKENASFWQSLRAFPPTDLMLPRRPPGGVADD